MSFKTITTQCSVCKKVELLQVDEELYDDYLHGQCSVQHVFKNLTPAQREFHFISKICGKCWDELFLEDDEDLS